MSACRAVHVARGGGECTRPAGHPGRHSWEAPKNERWCERCEMWLSPKLVDDVSYCCIHQAPTETPEQIRRDRDEYRSTAAQVSRMADACRAATGEDYHTVARLRADLAEALARLNAVGEAIEEADCECPCGCLSREHGTECSLCLACRVEQAAFGGPR